MNNILNYCNSFINGTKTMFQDFFSKDVDKNKKQRANMWTFSRLAIPLFTLITSIIAIVTNLYPLYIVSGSLAAFGGVTDWFDGRSSRKHQSESEYGKVLDQITDKSFSFIIAINLLFLNINYLLILLGEALISGVNATYKLNNKNLSIDSSKIGKIKQWPLFATLAFGYLSPLNSITFNISNCLVLLTFVFELITANEYLHTNKKNLNKMKNDTFNNIPLSDVNTEEREKVKTLEIGSKNAKNNSNIIRRKEKYIQLKKMLTEEVIQNYDENEEKSNQKKLKK